MIVKIGWNTQYAEQKFDVGLDETDLARILAEEGIPPDAQLTSAEAFTILLTRAEWFSEHVRAMKTGDGNARELARKACDDYNDRLAKVKARLGLG